MSLQSWVFGGHDDTEEISSKIQCAAENEDGSVQSDSEVPEIVQYPTDTYILFVSNRDPVKLNNSFSFDLCVFFFSNASNG